MNIKRILVVYLYTKFDDLKKLKNFINKYKKNKAGLKHDLLICFKLIEKKNSKKLIQFINKNLFIKKKFFFDTHRYNDFDFGSYYRVSKKYKNHAILFLNSNSFPQKKNWLKILMKHFSKNTLIGSTSSFSSHANNSFYRKKNQTFFSYLKNIFYSNFLFERFPNPHLRTCNFLIHSNIFNEFMKQSRPIKSKYDAHILESGRKGLTNFFKKTNRKIFVINSDTKKFELENSYQSETFAINNQKKLIICDKHTEIYNKLNDTEKKSMSKRVWGKIF